MEFYVWGCKTDPKWFWTRSICFEQVQIISDRSKIDFQFDKLKCSCENMFLVQIENLFWVSNKIQNNSEQSTIIWKKQILGLVQENNVFLFKELPDEKSSLDNKTDLLFCSKCLPLNGWSKFFFEPVHVLLKVHLNLNPSDWNSTTLLVGATDC